MYVREFAKQQDGWIRAIRKVLKKDEYEDFFIKSQLLYKDHVKELIVVLSLMEEEIIRMVHKQGPFSIRRTEEAVKKNFWIPLLGSKAAKVVRSCI